MVDPSTTSDLGSLAVDPELLGFLTRPDYHHVLDRLRSEAPVYEYRPGSWTVAAYDDVRAVSRDPERFRSGAGVLMDDLPRQGVQLPGSILHMDPPQHAEWRRIASRWFTPRAMAGLGARIRELTVDVLDGLQPDDEIDLVESVASPIPVLVIADLLGIGDGDREDFRRWSDACIEVADQEGSTTAEATDDDTMAAVGELLGFLGEHAARRRTEPTDDLMSVLASAEVEGRPLHGHEIVMYSMSLLVAGNETTRHLISGAVAALAEHPDQRRALVGADDDALGAAVEESLRWVTPIQTFGRTATTDLELGGSVISEGDWVVLLYASANRDERAFGPTADRFDALRSPNPAHLAFGFGEHLCLGAGLARMEGRIFLDEFLRRFADYSVTGPPTWTRSTLVRGYSALPVTLA